MGKYFVSIPLAIKWKFLKTPESADLNEKKYSMTLNQNKKFPVYFLLSLSARGRASTWPSK